MAIALSNCHRNEAIPKHEVVIRGKLFSHKGEPFSNTHIVFVPAKFKSTSSEDDVRPVMVYGKDMITLINPHSETTDDGSFQFSVDSTSCDEYDGFVLAQKDELDPSKSKTLPNWLAHRATRKLAIFARSQLKGTEVYVGEIQTRRSQR